MKYLSILFVMLAATQFMFETVTILKPDGTVQTLIVEKEEDGVLVINPETGDVTFVITDDSDN